MSPGKELGPLRENSKNSKIRVQLSIWLEKNQWDDVREIAERHFQTTNGKKLAVSRAVETLIGAALGAHHRESSARNFKDAKLLGLSVVRRSWFNRGSRDGLADEEA